MSVVSVHDVAKYILKNSGRMTTMKLQKLVYYCQAWSLVWDDCPLFSARIEAWANGPIIPELYRLHRGKYFVSSWAEGNTENFSVEQKKTINAVLKYYGDKDAWWLSVLTHSEQPWKEARKKMHPDERGNNPIDLGLMKSYYLSLINN